MVQQSHIDQPGEIWAPPGYEAITVPSSLYGQSINWEGRDGEFDDIDPSTGLQRGNQTKLMRRVRYVGDSTLAAGDALVYTSGYHLNRGRVDKATVAPDATHIGNFDGVVNEHISGSIYPGQMFWMTVKGHDKVKIATADAIAIGDRLIVNGTGTVGPTTLAATTAGMSELAAGQRCLAAAIKAATGGDATTVATLCDLNLDPHSVD